jgi:rhamnulose-1-phosphate aldolase
MIDNSPNLFNHKDDLCQNDHLKPVFAQISEIAQYLWDRGWAERNAGNFSINITGLFTGREMDRLSDYHSYPLSKIHPGLARNLLLVSAAGTRMRDVARKPTENVCFVYVNESGSVHHILNGTQHPAALKPTSEIEAHLAIQQQLLQKKSSEKVILHAHVTELIALTHVAKYTSEGALNMLLWGMHPETLLFLPDGVGFIPFKIPGSENIALATLKGFDKHKVVLWEKHGCMALGDSIADAFDYLDILAKSAKIYFLSKSYGIEPKGLSYLQLKEIRSNLPK